METSLTLKIKTNSRLIGLDLLRLLAIVLVLGRHMWPPPENWSDGWTLLMLAWGRGGWVGVDLFFVLSGFLISGLLFAEYKSRGSLSFVRFYTRRGWKIYPPFFAMLISVIAVHSVIGRPVAWNTILAEVLFVQDYFDGIWGYTWSLAVEEHFYILLPLTLMLMLKWNKNAAAPLKPILTLTICLAILEPFLRWINADAHPVYSHLTHLYPTHLRIDALLFGVAISYLYHFHTDQFVKLFSPWRWWLICGGILMFAPAFIWQLETTFFIHTLGFTMFYLGSGMLMVGVLLCNIPDNRVFKFLAKIGTYSYSIYLWHMPTLFFLLPTIDTLLDGKLGYLGQVLVFFFSAILIGVMMAKFVEIPALKLRDRWFPATVSNSTLRQK